MSTYLGHSRIPAKRWNEQLNSINDIFFRPPVTFAQCIIRSEKILMLEKTYIRQKKNMADVIVKLYRVLSN